MSVYKKIAEYGSEFGVDNLNVDTLISSHRAMRGAIRSDQKIWLDALDGARQRAYQQVMDATWVRIEDLRKMSVKELVDLLNE
jgi:hypothetical protein